MDMHSGGSSKLDWEYILIEAPEAEARAVFYNRFGLNPDAVACTCCGENFSVTESPTLAQATGYDRKCAYRDGAYVEEPRKGAVRVYTVGEYLARPDVRVIYRADIPDRERTADIPAQGYVWVG
jgi:hypothetical protein